MKPIYVLIIVIFSLGYIILGLFVSSLISFNDTIQSYELVLDKLNLAVFGAFIAIYNMIFNFTKTLLEKLKMPKLRIGIDCLKGGSNLTLKLAFTNSIESNLKINDIKVNGYDNIFEPIEVEQFKSANVECEFSKSKELKQSKNLLGKTSVRISYTIINSFKNKSVTKRIKL